MWLFNQIKKKTLNSKNGFNENRPIKRISCFSIEDLMYLETLSKMF